MGYKMKGSPMHSGTAAHKSALKQQIVKLGGLSKEEEEENPAPTKQRKNIFTGRTRTVTKSDGKKTIVVTDKKGNVRKEKTKTKGNGKNTETKKYNKDGAIKSHTKINRKKEHIIGHGNVTKRTKIDMLKK